MRNLRKRLLFSVFTLAFGMIPFQAEASTKARQALPQRDVTTLRKKIGGIDIAAFPEGVNISFNGKNYTTSLAIDSLAVGSYKFVLSKPGYASTDTTFVVTEGKTSFYNVFLPVLAGKSKLVAQVRSSKSEKVSKTKKTAKAQKPTKAEKAAQAALVAKAEQEAKAKEAAQAALVAKAEQEAKAKQAAQAALVAKAEQDAKAAKKNELVETASPVVSKSKKHHPTNFLALAEAGTSFKGDPSFGLMMGVVKRNGFYLKGMSSFNNQFIERESLGSELINMPDGSQASAFYQKGFRYKTLYLSGGYVREICKPLLVYVGTGYGKHEVIWTTTDNVTVVNRALSMNAVIAEGGLICRMGKFAISCGYQTIKFYTGELHVGIGVSL